MSNVVKEWSRSAGVVTTLFLAYLVLLFER